MKRIIGIISLCAIILSGCKENSNIYSGIEKNDIEDISNSKNIEFVYEYKGHTDHWAATYHVYKSKNNVDEHTSRLVLKYIGKQPEPTGELRYAYETEGGGSGNGTLPGDMSEAGIYYLGHSGGNGSIAAQNSLVKVQVAWNGNTESFELKPEISR
ncbi:MULTISPECIES: hypothetical protein [unclassified Paenibacillus]|uniref:hypothetical protein n=1 Tax=unclassified Paenibacillus TaxID=185978 RepID=UPI0027853710|nr:MULTISPECIES: hypothetical protein [unclassified Paenibacillus]MDQ0899148.1 hypothetical protein [Paenibacillus sp. V4I7]MDQ0914867.1 hypothetical protein [Paenibacillus sp. V4I5]